MTQIRQRSCITCGTHNSADAFLCRNCRGILSDDAELIEEEPELAPIANGRSPIFSPNGSRPSGKKQGQKLPRKIVVMFSIMMLLLVVMGGIFAALPKHPSPPSTSTPTLTPTPNLAPLHLPAGLGVFKVAKGEYIGINDGAIHNGFFSPIDVSRLDNQEETAAAQDLSNKNENAAILALQAGMKLDTNDAEAGIYWQNIVAVDSENYVSLVVAVDISPGGDVLSSRRVLQGAYTSQKEFNSANNPVKLRLLIANSGDNLSYVNPVAQQIVRVAQQEHIVGVLGWQASSSCHQAIATLAAAHIPMLSQTASSDDLTNYHYFFRVVPDNKAQATVAAKFAFSPKPDGLGVSNAIVFLDPNDSYSRNITNDFENDFKGEGGKILDEEDFTTDKTTARDFTQLIYKTLAAHPTVDMFYFAGVSSNDATAFQNALPITKQYVDLPVIAADASYDAQPKSLGRWYLTAFAFPDEWSILTNNQNLPAFFSKYSANFDPSGTHGSAPYDYDRAHPVAILSYDAATALSRAIQSAAQKNAYNITSQQVDDLLPKTNFQGVSGQIVFDANHDPQKKTIVLLGVSQQGFYMRCISGIFDPIINQTAYSCPL